MLFNVSELNLGVHISLHSVLAPALIPWDEANYISLQCYS